jgi:cell division protease FtsH
MVMMMGGRVAEEIVFGQVSTGAQNDLERITKMAYAMVTDYGMSERIGYLSFNLGGYHEEPMFTKPYSAETGRIIDEEVKAIIAEVRQGARELLSDKRAELESLAQALLAKEVLSASEIEEFLGPRPHARPEEVEEWPSEEEAPQESQANGVASDGSDGTDSVVETDKDSDLPADGEPVEHRA